MRLPKKTRSKLQHSVKREQQHLEAWRPGEDTAESRSQPSLTLSELPSSHEPCELEGQSTPTALLQLALQQHTEYAGSPDGDWSFLASTQPEACTYPLVELPAGNNQLSSPGVHTPVLISPQDQPAGPKFAVSAISQPSWSTGVVNQPFVPSPQSFIASDSAAPTLTHSEPVADGSPLFADHTTHSPLELAGNDIPPWHDNATSVQATGCGLAVPVTELSAEPADGAHGANAWTQGSGPLAFTCHSQGGSLQENPLLYPPTPPPGQPPAQQMTGLADSLPSAGPGPELGHNTGLIPPSPATPVSSPGSAVSLDNLAKTFAKIRKEAAYRGNGVAPLPELADRDALLAGIDELEKLVQGQMGGPAPETLNFSLLALSMAVETKETLSADLGMLWNEMARFIQSEGGYGLPACFLEVSSAFLDCEQAPDLA